MKNIFVLILLLNVISVIAQNPSEKRLALIIGNSEYLNGGKLKNPVNDADLMAVTLENLGFDVIKKTNASLREMQMAVSEFTQKIAQYDVALFFYAGHGIQIDGENYLIPIDAKMESREIARYEAFNISDVNRAFSENSNKINVMILDACRNDPFKTWSRGGERGFKKIDNSAKGTIIAFATQPGETAADGAGNNGLYTSHLVEQMKVGQDIEDVFKNTRIAVNNASEGKQIPQDWSSLMGNFYFTKPQFSSGSTTTIVKEELVTGTVMLSSEISGTIFLDGKELSKIKEGSTNRIIDQVEVGIHTLEIVSPYEKKQKKITVQKDQITEVVFISDKFNDETAHNFTDRRDGNIYKVVKVGRQIWMAQNLAYNTYEGNWMADDDIEKLAENGYLYNWQTAQDVCPQGWRLPTKEDFVELSRFIGESKNDFKSKIEKDELGFYIRNIGFRNYDGKMNNKSESCYFWTNNPMGEFYATSYYFDFHERKIGQGRRHKNLAFPVRCIRDR